MALLYLMRGADYSLSMPCAPIVCYYSSAKPQSGYSGAVRGYAQKLAAALGFEVRTLEDLPAGIVPEITIGLEGYDWPQGIRPAHELKARPYGDQYGFGPSMHPLTTAALAAAYANFQQPRGRIGLVCVANPHWLAEQAALWVQRLQQWQTANQIGRLIITNSPRTNDLAWQAFVDALNGGFFHNHLINNFFNGENHYLAALARADAICLLGTSRSMAGEAAMSRAPIAIAFDNQDDENHFFAAIQQEFLPLRERFSPFEAEIALQSAEYEPFDVTEGYVRQALAQIRRKKAA